MSRVCDGGGGCDTPRRQSVLPHCQPVSDIWRAAPVTSTQPCLVQVLGVKRLQAQAWLPLAARHCPTLWPSVPSDCLPAGQNCQLRTSHSLVSRGEGRIGGGWKNSSISLHLYLHSRTSNLLVGFKIFKKIFFQTPFPPSAHFPAAQNCWLAILHGPFRWNVLYSLRGKLIWPFSTASLLWSPGL